MAQSGAPAHNGRTATRTNEVAAFKYTVRKMGQRLGKRLDNGLVLSQGIQQAGEWTPERARMRMQEAQP